MYHCHCKIFILILHFFFVIKIDCYYAIIYISVSSRFSSFKIKVRFIGQRLNSANKI